MNNETKIEYKILRKTKKLPRELKDIIFEYIPEKVRIFLNKTLYLANHYLVRSYIPHDNIELYYRSLVRQDNNFVFRLILFENYWRWINIRQYYYKGSIFLNYLYFIRAYCIENEAIKCIEVINNFFKQVGLEKNLHKKKVIQYIKWM